MPSDETSTDQPVHVAAGGTMVNVEALKLKNEGNECFKAGEMEKALALFSQAINLEANSTLYNNRSLVYFSMRHFEKSVEDAKRAVQLDKKYTKAYNRLVKGLIELNRIKEARKFLLLAFREVGEKDKNLMSLEVELNGLWETPLRPRPSDFEIVDEIGSGNFSKIYTAQLKKTGIVYAVKVIELMTVDRIRRRHKNVDNEIMMEKKVLYRLDHPAIVTLHATFKDMGSLYYQMEFLTGGQLWDTLGEMSAEGSRNMVGSPLSLAKFYMMEAINGVEYMHRAGVVHRDIKPENMIISKDGHLKFVDFGTAKDLINKELNGPEFVGTPEYMSAQTIASKDCGMDSDLWALGVVLYQMLVGYTPFSASSPYLIFLRAKRANWRAPAFLTDAEKQLLDMLLHRDPKKRLRLCSEGSKCNAFGYDAMRRLSFFQQDLRTLRCDEEGREESTVLAQMASCHDRPAVVVPTLKDLSIRAVGKAALIAAEALTEAGGAKSALAGDMRWVQTFSLVAGATTPHTGSLSLNERNRAAVMHYLNRRKQLLAPCLYRLFWPSLVDSRCIRVDPTSREYFGYSFQEHGGWSEPTKALHFVHLACPLFGQASLQAGKLPTDAESAVQYCSTEATSLRALVSKVNRCRFRFMIVTGSFTSLSYASADKDNGAYTALFEQFRKNVARLSDSIPLVLVPGEAEMGMSLAHNVRAPQMAALEHYRSKCGLDYYGFWYNAVRALVINSSLFFALEEGSEASEEVKLAALAQEEWLKEEVDQCKLCSAQLMLVSSHQWFPYNSSCEEEPSSTNKAQYVPPTATRRWLSRLQHAKVRYLVCSSASETIDALQLTVSREQVEHTLTPKKKTRRYCFPSAPAAAATAKLAKATARKEARLAHRQQKTGQVEELPDKETAEQEAKRACLKDTPTKLGKSVGSDPDWVNSTDETPLLPSQMIANARARGELPPAPQAPAVAPPASAHTLLSAPPLPQGSPQEKGLREMPDLPEEGREPVYSDTDSDDHDDDDDDDDDRDSSSDSDNEGTIKEREPGFRNINKALPGPELLPLWSSCVSPTVLGDDESLPLGVRVFMVKDQDTIPNKFYSLEDLPTEAAALSL